MVEHGLGLLFFKLTNYHGMSENCSTVERLFDNQSLVCDFRILNSYSCTCTFAYGHKECTKLCFMVFNKLFLNFFLMLTHHWLFHCTWVLLLID